MACFLLAWVRKYWANASRYAYRRSCICMVVQISVERLCREHVKPLVVQVGKCGHRRHMPLGYDAFELSMT